jgi:hypothetical protein
MATTAKTTQWGPAWVPPNPAAQAAFNKLTSAQQQQLTAYQSYLQNMPAGNSGNEGDKGGNGGLTKYQSTAPSTSLLGGKDMGTNGAVLLATGVPQSQLASTIAANKESQFVSENGGQTPAQAAAMNNIGGFNQLVSDVAIGAISGGAGSAIGGLGGAVAGGALGGAGTSVSTQASAGQPISASAVGKGALIGGVSGGLGYAAAPATSALTSAGVPAPIAAGVVKGGIGAGTGALTAKLTGGNVGSSALVGGAGGFINGAVSNATGNSTLGKIASGAAAPLVGGPAPQRATGGMGIIGGALGAGAAGAGAGTPSNSGGNIGNIGNMAGTSTDSTLAGTIGGALPGLLQAGAGTAGSLAAANAQVGADQSAITTQQSAMGNINGIWGTQQKLGQGADTSLGSALGTNGAAPNYSGFENMPGYQFAQQQGTQAIQRQAAAMGSAYTPNTAAAVGQYVTGTAMQDYNTYISQLMGAAGLGTTANQGLQTGTQNTSNNISQLQQNQGQAKAAGYTGVASAVGGLFSPNGAGTGLLGSVLSGGNGSTGGGTGGTGSGVNTGSSPSYAGQNPDEFGGNSSGYTGTTDQTGVGTAGDGDYGFGTPTDTGSTDFGGSLDYGSTASDGTDFLGGWG